jgi:hypothetical protein
MTELIQARYYFTHFKHDDWKLKVVPSALNPVCLRLIFFTDACIGRFLSRHCFHSGRLCLRVSRRRSDSALYRLRLNAVIVHNNPCWYVSDCQRLEGPPTIYMQAISCTLLTSTGYVKYQEPQAWNNCNIPAHPVIPLYHRRDRFPGPELSSCPILVDVCVSSFQPSDLSQEYRSSTRNILVTLLNSFLIIVAVRRRLSSCAPTASYSLSAVHSSEAHSHVA